MYDSQRRHQEATPGQAANGAVERDFEGRCADDEHDHRADEPPDRKAEKGAGGYHRADDEVDRHESEQQRPPPPPPSRGQPRTGHREHGREHRDPPRIVEELREKRVQPIGQVEMPLRGGDAVACDGKRNEREERRGRVRAEQLPLPRHEQADQDHERQRQNREAVDQVHQIRLGRRQDSDDLGDRLLQRVPFASRDQRARDHGSQENGRENDPQDVIGPAGQWLQQAARNGDFAPVDPHVPASLHVAAAAGLMRRTASPHAVALAGTNWRNGRPAVSRMVSTVISETIAAAIT